MALILTQLKTMEFVCQFWNGEEAVLLCEEYLSRIAVWSLDFWRENERSAARTADRTWCSRTGGPCSYGCFSRKRSWYSWYSLECHWSESIVRLIGGYLNHKKLSESIHLVLYLIENFKNASALVKWILLNLLIRLNKIVFLFRGFKSVFFFLF